MTDRFCISVFDNTIRLNMERWRHITMSHDYMLDKIELVIETLSKPEFVVSAYTGEFYAIKKINTADLGEKSCIVIYHDKPNGFVITSLLTSKPEKFLEKGDIIWKQ